MEACGLKISTLVPGRRYYAEDSATTFNWALTDTEEGGHYGVGSPVMSGCKRKRTLWCLRIMVTLWILSCT